MGNQGTWIIGEMGGQRSEGEQETRRVPCGRVCAYVAQGTKARWRRWRSPGGSSATRGHPMGSRCRRNRDTENPSLSPSCLLSSLSLTRSLVRSVPLRSLALSPLRSFVRSLARSLAPSFARSFAHSHAYPFSTARGSCFRFSDATSARSCATTKTTRSASSCRRRPSAVVLVSVLVAVVVLLLLLLPLLLPLRRLLPLLFRSCRSRDSSHFPATRTRDIRRYPPPAVGQPPRYRVRRAPTAEAAKRLGHTTQ